jgi:hypothetical protein
VFVDLVSASDGKTPRSGAANRSFAAKDLWCADDLAKPAQDAIPDQHL